MILPPISFKGSKTAVLLWSLSFLALISTAGFYFLALKPKEGELSRLEGEYQVKRGEKRAKEVTGGIDDELKGFYNRLPEWGDFTKVMGEIYGKADRLNLLIESANYRSEKIKGTDLLKVTVSMPVTGTYADIKRFIHELETSPRLFIIEELSLASGKGEEGEVSLKLAIAVHFRG
jgi:Tfp pilus assembly protein PilO